MMMPPMPEPSHASAPASAGTERDPPTSLAMSLSATAVIQAAPNDIPRTASATEATAQEALVSMELEGDCNIRRETRLADTFYQPHGISPPTSTSGLLYVLHCVKMHEPPWVEIPSNQVRPCSHPPASDAYVGPEAKARHGRSPPDHPPPSASI
jgi:hypothetical protein